MRKINVYEAIEKDSHKNTTPNICANADDVQRYGANAAILLYNFRFWLDVNLKNKKAKHMQAGRVWTYSSYEDLAKKIPLTVDQIRTAISTLKREGAITIDNFNTMGCDKTYWYSVNDPKYMVNPAIEAAKLLVSEAKRYGDLVRKVSPMWEKSRTDAGNIPHGVGEIPHGSGKNPAPIPDIATDIDGEPANKTHGQDLTNHTVDPTKGCKGDSQDKDLIGFNKTKETIPLESLNNNIDKTPPKTTADTAPSRLISERAQPTDYAPIVEASNTSITVTAGRLANDSVQGHIPTRTELIEYCAAKGYHADLPDTLMSIYGNTWLDDLDQPIKFWRSMVDKWSVYNFEEMRKNAEQAKAKRKAKKGKVKTKTKTKSEKSNTVVPVKMFKLQGKSVGELGHAAWLYRCECHETFEYKQHDKCPKCHIALAWNKIS